MPTTIKISQTLDYLTLSSEPTLDHHAVRKQDLDEEITTLSTAIEEIKTFVNDDGTLDSLQEINNYLAQNTGVGEVIHLSNGRLEDHDTRLEALEAGTSVDGQISTSATGDNAIHASAGGITTATTAAGVVSAGGKISTTLSNASAIDAVNGGITAAQDITTTGGNVIAQLEVSAGGKISTSSILSDAINASAGGISAAGVVSAGGQISTTSNMDYAINAPNGGIKATKIEVQGHLKSTGGGDISTGAGDISTSGGQITSHAIKTGVDGNELPAINAVNGFIRAGSASNNAIYAENGGITAAMTIESTSGDIRIANGVVRFDEDATDEVKAQAYEDSSFLYFGTKWRINGQNDGTHLVFEWNGAVDGDTPDWQTAVPFIVTPTT